MEKYFKKRKLNPEETTNGSENKETSNSCEVNKRSPVYVYEGQEIVPMSCKQPSFRDQRIIATEGVHKLDNVNSVVVVHNLLNEKDLDAYLSHAVKVRRIGGKSAGYASKPRKQRCLTVTGGPDEYTGTSHINDKYPKYVLTVVKKMMEKFNNYIDDQTNPFKTLSLGVDIVYSNEFARGGSVGMHQDKEMGWGLVFIFSLGQQRWLRVRRNQDKKYFNAELRHNSLVAMYGETFQQLYTHQVDKLSVDEKVGIRLSLNVRFLRGDWNVDELLEKKADPNQSPKLEHLEENSKCGDTKCQLETPEPNSTHEETKVVDPHAASH